MIHDSNSLGDDRIDLIVVSVDNLCAAQSLIDGCEACSEEAEIPFDWILDRVTGRKGSTTDYFLIEPAACPRCKGAITEKTLVQWDGGVGFGVFTLHGS